MIVEEPPPLPFDSPVCYEPSTKGYNGGAYLLYCLHQESDLSNQVAVSTGSVVLCDHWGGGKVTFMTGLIVVWWCVCRWGLSVQEGENWEPGHGDKAVQ